MKRTRLRPVSAKRARENRARRKALHAAYGDRPACVACPVLLREGIQTGCYGHATDGHELVRRGQGGSIIDVTNIVPVGRMCHLWIGDHPIRARELGLELRPWEPPYAR